jgi:hypothetical protein
MPRKSKRQLHYSKTPSGEWTDRDKRQKSVDEEEKSEIIMEADVRDEESGDESRFIDKLDLPTIADLFQLCKSACGSRKMSVLLYMLLRYLDHNWKQIDDLFQTIGAYRCETAHKWTKVFINNDLEVFDEQGRDGNNCGSFYDMFPEIETEAKVFAFESCSHKSADFTALDLANFIDTKFYEISQTAKVTDVLVRSVESCRLDLRRWGAKFQPNSQRPYFEGHERPDVVAHRQEFVSYFLQNKNQYYTITNDDQPKWVVPSQNPRVLICKFHTFFQHFRENNEFFLF